MKTHLGLWVQTLHPQPLLQLLQVDHGVQWSSSNNWLWYFSWSFVWLQAYSTSMSSDWCFHSGIEWLEHQTYPFQYFWYSFYNDISSSLKCHVGDWEYLKSSLFTLREIYFHSVNLPTWLNYWNVCDFCFQNPHVHLIGLVFIVVWRKTCNFCINDPSTSTILCKLKYTLVIYICCISDTDGFLSLVGVIKINNSL